MKHHFIFILIFVFFGCINADAQGSKLKYLLVEVYADSGFIKLDTAKHSMGVYSLKKSKKKKIKSLPQQIFCFGKSKSTENILLEIDNKDFNISAKKVQSMFAVLKVYINADAVNNNTDLVVKSGDVIYKLASCNKCHKIEVFQLPIIVDSDGSPTTGYKVLNDYILK